MNNRNKVLDKLIKFDYYVLYTTKKEFFAKTLKEIKYVKTKYFNSYKNIKIFGIKGSKKYPIDE